MRPRPAVNSSNWSLRPGSLSNRYLRRAAQLSATLNLTKVDEDGDEMARILTLMHIGERVERQKARAVTITLVALASLLAAGAVVGRRRMAASHAQWVR